MQIIVIYEEVRSIYKGKTVAFRLINFYGSEPLSADLEKNLSDMEGMKNWSIKKDHDNVQYSFLVDVKKAQILTDKLQPVLGRDPKAQIVVIPVSSAIPSFDEEEAETDDLKKKQEAKKPQTISREELYVEVSQGAILDRGFMLMVVLSTVVAAIGLLESNVAVVIGAMVIAPLLGPNLAFALATVLADDGLLKKAFKTNVVGLGLAIILSIILGMVWTGDLEISQEFMARTDIGISGIILAIASGAAAVLSLVTGTSSALVGVMVAVALLPPAVVLGVSIGAGQFSYAFGAFLLLAANIISVNLSAISVLILKGVEPRKWQEKREAKSLRDRYLMIWGIGLALVFVLLTLKAYFHNSF